MKVRHKIPSVFSLSMVDVLCCALGCVILLWLLGAKQSEELSTELREQSASEKESSQQLLARAEDARANLGEHLNALLLDRDRAVALEARLRQRIQEMERAGELLSETLSSEQRRSNELGDRLRTALARAGTLQADVKAGASKLEAEKKKVGALDRKLVASEGKLKTLRADLDEERGRASTQQGRLSNLQREIDARKRELSELKQALADAESARKKLAETLILREGELNSVRKDRTVALADATKALDSLKQQTTILRSERDSRFAGIALTGKRVIFLVDSSGSMELLDDSTRAPEKWDEVGKTAARLMRSLSTLEQFQLICFSSKPTFPLGGEGRWLDHSAKQSPRDILNALAKVKPKGGTNMYAALESAFDYRAKGLDAIYLLSDGLPNQGEGITLNQRSKLTEVERGVLLGSVIRKKLKNDWNKPGKSARVKINTLGFFYESPDLGSFLWALARENDGSFVGMSRP